MSTTPPNDEVGADQFIERIKKGNDEWRNAYRGPPPMNGSAQAVVLTCMDSRIPPLEMMGLSPGEVFIVRNAGNCVTPDTVRSLLICLTVMECRRILVVGHTHCGMRRPCGTAHPALEEVDEDGLRFHFASPELCLQDWIGFHQMSEEQWVRHQVRELGTLMEKALPDGKVKVLGALYHLDDGRLEFL
jgi:carbonic anhydrase